MTFRLLWLGLLPTLGLSESLTFVAGGDFSGDLLSITEEQGVAIQTPRSPEPLYFRLDGIKELSLATAEATEISPFQTERLVLTNGDIIPGSLVGLGKESLTFEGPLQRDLGAVTVPRDQLKTLRFGIRPQRLIYQGPAPLDQWTGSGIELWSLSEDNDQSLLLLSPGEIAQDIGLARQFILQFDLHWQEEPSVRIYFCDDGKGASKSDRYYIDVNHSGLQIKRERSTSPHWGNLISLDSNLEAFDDNHLAVEVRGNRLLGTLELYLDGELVRQAQDTSDRTIGTGIIVVRNKTEQAVTQLSNLKAFSWDAVSQLQLLEETGDGSGDTLVDAEGRRMTGQLMELVMPAPEPIEEPKAEEKSEEPATPEGDSPEQDQPTIPTIPVEGEEPAEEGESRKPAAHQEEATEKEDVVPSYFLFQSPFAAKPVEIPAEKTRIIYFQEDKVKALKEAPPASNFQILLDDDGLISANNLTITGDLISFTHPLLGEMTLPRASVHTIRNFPPLNDDNE